MSSKETVVSPEILDARGEALVKGIGAAIDHGLSRDDVRWLEKVSPLGHRDLFRVYLGLKPAATGLVREFSMYALYQDYLEYFPQEKDTGVDVLCDSLRATLWNPALCREVIEREDSTHKILDQVSLPVSFKDPSSHEFGRVINVLADVGSPTEVNYLAGLLHGTPPAAAELFTKFDYREKVVNAIVYLWQEAEKRGLETREDSEFSWGGFVMNEYGLKDEILRLASEIGLEDKELHEYLKGLRYADIPGTPFVTSSDVTCVEEEMARRLYELTGVDKRLEVLLDPKN